MTTGIDYLDEQLSPIAMRCSFKGCPCRPGCWHLKRAHRMSCNPNFPDDVREAYRGGPPVLIQKRLEMPLHWKQPRRIGVQFMGDWMDDQVKCEWIDLILEVIAACPQHQFFSLTKQPQNLIQPFQKWYKERWYPGYMPNLYNGVSICDQEDWDSKKHDFLDIPGKKWISYEPALTMVRFGLHLYEVDWLMSGAESGPKRRPCPHEWMVDVVEQCQAAGVPCYVKQIDLNGRVCHDISLFPEALKVKQWPA